VAVTAAGGAAGVMKRLASAEATTLRLKSTVDALERDNKSLQWQVAMVHKPGGGGGGGGRGVLGGGGADRSSSGGGAAGGPEGGGGSAGGLLPNEVGSVVSRCLSPR
jgi:hypothetical protein